MIIFYLDTLFIVFAIVWLMWIIGGQILYHIGKEVNDEVYGWGLTVLSAILIVICFANLIL